MINLSSGGGRASPRRLKETYQMEKKVLGLYLVVIGNGKVVHAATGKGDFLSPYSPICGSKPNRGRIMRTTSRVAKGTPVTCQKCAAKLEAMRA